MLFLFQYVQVTYVVLLPEKLKILVLNLQKGTTSYLGTLAASILPLQPLTIRSWTNLSGHGQKATCRCIPNRLWENGLQVFPRHFPTHSCDSSAALQQHPLLPSTTLIQPPPQSSILCSQCLNLKNPVKEHKCRAFSFLRLCHHHGKMSGKVVTGNSHSRLRLGRCIRSSYTAGSYLTSSQTYFSISTLQEGDTIPSCSDCPCGLRLCPKIVTWFSKAMALISKWWYQNYFY